MMTLFDKMRFLSKSMSFPSINLIMKSLGVFPEDANFLM